MRVMTNGIVGFVHNKLACIGSVYGGGRYVQNLS